MSSSSNFYNTGASVPNRRAPPPPPKPSGTMGAARRTAGAASKTGASTSRPQSAYQSSRATPRSSGTTTAAATRKAPVASRPVGSYYNSTPAAPTAASSVGGKTTAPSPYGNAAPAPSSTTADTPADNDADTWDDWGSPAPKTTTTPAASTNDWYSANNSAATTVPSSSAAASTNDWYTSNNSAPAYAGSGFHNKQSHQPQNTQMQPGTGFYQNSSNDNKQDGQQQPFLSGAMDTSAPMMSTMNPNSSTNSMNDPNTASSAMPSFSMFMPSAQSQGTLHEGKMDAYPPIEDEAPLLEELGINLEHIFIKTKAVVFPFSRFGGDQIDPAAICQDADLPGPIALLLLLGAEMMLAGKLQFGYIYMYGLFGCILMTFVVNLISPTEAVNFWTVISIMGYALLPVNILAFLKILVVNVIKLPGLGNILGGLTVLWSTLASTRLMELGCGLRDQRYLIMYPLLLFYSAFVMMTIL